MGMCDFPTGYYPPGQLSKIHGNTDRQHLVSRESVQETEVRKVEKADSKQR